MIPAILIPHPGDGLLFFAGLLLITAIVREDVAIIREELA